MAIKSERALLVTCVDQAYVNHAKQLFDGAWRYGNWCGSTMLLHRQLEAADLGWFLDRGVQVRPVTPFVSASEWGHMVGCRRLPSVVSDRWALLGAEFREWDVVVYLDSDIMVNGDLRPLLRVKRFGAVPDLGHLVIDQFKSPATAFRRARTDPRLRRLLWRRSFNCGVIVFRPRAVPDNIANTVRLSIQRLLTVGRFADQLAINVAIPYWERLPHRFNLCPHRPHFGGRHLSHLLPTQPSPTGLIYHYYGERKPWNPGHPHRSVWMTRMRQAADTRYPVPSAATPESRARLLDVFLYFHHLSLLVAMRLRRAVRTLFDV